MRPELQAIAVLAICTLAAVPVRGANERGVAVTYYKDVLPIMQENCQTCHRPTGANISGLIAPMSFMDYRETRPWARAIASKVQAREMPPWFASAPKGVFENERGLTDAEIDTIVRWVEAGAPAGNMADAPPPEPGTVDPNDGWSLATPDFVVKTPEPYLVEDYVYDMNIVFYTKLTEDVLPKNTWVKGWELRVGDNRITHHMCAAVISGDGHEQLLSCLAAGSEADMLPDGFGVLLEKGATIEFDMHYHKEAAEGSAVWSDPEIGFFVADKPTRHEVITDNLSNRGFLIPPNHPNYRVASSRVLKKDTLVLTLWPHAHLRATAARYVAHYPDGTEELLLDVPYYDQAWQVTYHYREPKLLPKGTRIDIDFWYDNSRERASRRNYDSNRFVGHGPRTEDEMSLGFIGYAEIEEPHSWLRRSGSVPVPRSARRTPGDTDRETAAMRSPPPPFQRSQLVRTSLTLNARRIEIAFSPEPEVENTASLSAVGPRTRVGDIRAHPRLQVGMRAPYTQLVMSDAPSAVWLVRDAAGWAVEIEAVAGTADRTLSRVALKHHGTSVGSPAFAASLHATGADSGRLDLRWRNHAWSTDFRFPPPPRPGPRPLVSGRGDLRTAQESTDEVARLALLGERNESALVLQSGVAIHVVFGKDVGVDSPDYAAVAQARNGAVLETAGAPVLRLTSDRPLHFGRAELPTGNLAPGTPAVYGVWLRRTPVGWSFVFNDEADSWGTRHDSEFDVAEVVAEYRRTEDSDRPFSAAVVPTDVNRATLIVSWGSHQWAADFFVD